VYVKTNLTVAEALKELHDMVVGKWKIEFDRAHDKYPMVPRPELFDHEFNAWTQCYECLLAVIEAEDRRQLNEIAQKGT
jgi:hypothetical protein